MKCLKLLLLGLLLYPKLSSAQKFELVNSGNVIKQCAALYDSGKYKQALQLNNISRSDTNYVWSLYERAISCEADSQYSKAVDYCREALALKEQRDWEPELYNIYANSLMDMSQFEKSRQVFDAGIAKYPAYSLLYFNKGVSYMSEKRWAEAEIWFQKALLINPYMNSAHYRLGLAALNQGKILPAYLSFLGYLLMTPDGRYWKNALGYLSDISRGTDEILDVKNKRTISPDANYQAVEDIVFSKIALDPAYKSIISIDDPVAKQIQAVFEKLEYSDTNNDFWIQYYLPYYKQVFGNKDKFELFIYHIFSNVDVPLVQDYVKKNKKPMQNFTNEAGAFFNTLRATRELSFKNRDTVTKNWIFENGELVGYGAGGSNGKLLSGAWKLYYEYGNLKGKGSFNAAGKREGDWLAYFFTGQLKAKEHYINGKMQGLQQYYFDNGNPSSAENYVDDKLEGAVTTYYYAGNVKSASTYRQGKKDGEVKEYYANGVLQSVTPFNNGVQSGEMREYFKNGLIKDIEPFVDGKGEGAFKAYHDNGSLSVEGQVTKDNAAGEWKFYDDNGKLKETRNYANDKEDGLHQEYFDNGQLSCTYNLKKDKKDGEATYYYKDGKVYSKYVYAGGAVKSATYFAASGATLGSSTIDDADASASVISFSLAGVKRSHVRYDKKGNLDGPDTLFYSSGKIEEINQYKNNALNGLSVSYYQNGNKKSEINMTDDKEDGYLTSFYANGKPETEGWVQAGDYQGQWSFYDEKGRLTTKTYYLDGDLDGFKETYNTKGHKTLEEKYYRGWLDKLTQYDDAGNIITVDSFPKGSGKYVLYYPNKQKMEEGNYVNGEFDGPYKDYFFDGSVEVSCFYRGGVLDSTYTNYFYGGKKYSEGRYLYGNHTGTWKYYEEDGSLSETSPFVNDQHEGEKVYYFADGKKDYAAEYKDDEIDGLAQKYDPDGTLMYQVIFDQGEARSYSYLGKDGKPVPAVSLPFINGVMKTFYPDGKASRETTYSGGVANGRDVLYYTNGQIRSVDTSAYGVTEGLSVEYYQNGKTKFEYHYAADNADGICKEYYDTGILRKEIALDNGTNDGPVKYYDKAGKLVKTMMYDNGKLISVKNE